MSAVPEGSVREVESARSDLAIAGGLDASQRSGGRPVPMPPAGQSSRAPRARDGSGKSRRKRGSAIFRGARRLWVPLVIVVVIGAGGLTVSRLHGIFGSEKGLSYDDTKVDTKPFDPKHLRYEIFGPPGTVADISYFDVNTDTQHAGGVSLPWSLEFPMSATAIGNIAAQGDSDSIGCRIVVDGVVKAEKIMHEVSAYTSCRLKPDE